MISKLLLKKESTGPIKKDHSLEIKEQVPYLEEKINSIRHSIPWLHPTKGFLSPQVDENKKVIFRKRRTDFEIPDPFQTNNSIISIYDLLKRDSFNNIEYQEIGDILFHIPFNKDQTTKVKFSIPFLKNLESRVSDITKGGIFIPLKSPKILEYDISEFLKSAYLNGGILPVESSFKKLESFSYFPVIWTNTYDLDPLKENFKVVSVDLKSIYHEDFEIYHNLITKKFHQRK